MSTNHLNTDSNGSFEPTIPAKKDEKVNGHNGSKKALTERAVRYATEEVLAETLTTTGLSAKAFAQKATEEGTEEDPEALAHTEIYTNVLAILRQRDKMPTPDRHGNVLGEERAKLHDNVRGVLSELLTTHGDTTSLLKPESEDTAAA